MKQGFKRQGMKVAKATFGLWIIIFGGSLWAENVPVSANTPVKIHTEYRMLERLRRGGRYYVGAGAGKSMLDPDPGAPDFRVDDDTDLGIKFMAGYEVSDHVAVEVFTGSLGSSSLVDDAQARREIDYSIYGLNGVFNIEGWQGGFSPLLKLGANTINMDSSIAHENKDDWLFFGALGLEYEFNNRVALRAEYEYFSKDTQLVSLSLLKYFGGKKPKSYVVPPPESNPHLEDVPTSDSQIKPPAKKVAITAPDTDGDGVNDIEDACENTPVGANVDALGCASFEGIVQGVNFESNNARLTPAARKILDEMAVELKKFPKIKIQIEAHTDSQGDPGVNLWLSNSRAQSVIAYLSQQGIQASRLIPIGFGEANPIADNATEEGRAKNRRVEFQVTNSP